jgi:peptidoglycan/LPS O-acetylase OafA/YrhL
MRASPMWLRKLGTIAYGVYIIHMAVLGLLFALMRGHWSYYLVRRGLGSTDYFSSRPASVAAARNASTCSCGTGP